MAQITNSALMQELRTAAGIQPASDSIPSQISPQVVATCESNPRFTSPSLFCIANTATSSTAQTVYTTPANADFYLVSCQLSMIKDAGATSTLTALNLYVGGVAQNLIGIPGITGTAQNQSVSMSFPRPLKIDRNTIIQITNSTANAIVIGRASIVGFLVYNPDV